MQYILIKVDVTEVSSYEIQLFHNVFGLKGYYMWAATINTVAIDRQTMVATIYVQVLRHLNFVDVTNPVFSQFNVLG